jgi:hypothetical protein
MHGNAGTSLNVTVVFNTQTVDSIPNCNKNLKASVIQLGQ